MTKMVLALGCAAALLFASAEARAAQQGGAAPVAPGAKPEEAAKPQAAEGEGGKTEEGEAAKPEEAPPSAGAQGPETTPPESESGPLSLAELTRDGFEIRTTNFIPAEAVTRQSGKVSSDAVIITLQKTTSTAVCFYTLKAYVGKKLTTIPACTVHR
ncbi:MAG: hypothetical protein WED13_05720 [Methyloceanibacter sp.]